MANKQHQKWRYLKNATMKFAVSRAFFGDPALADNFSPLPIIDGAEDPPPAFKAT